MMKEIRNSWQLYKKTKDKEHSGKMLFVPYYRVSVESGLLDESWDQSWVARASLSALRSDQSSVTRHRDVIRSPDWECVVSGQIIECRGNIHYPWEHIEHLRWGHRSEFSEDRDCRRAGNENIICSSAAGERSPCPLLKCFKFPFMIHSAVSGKSFPDRTRHR